MKASFFAPASVGNFIAGFDILGLAIQCKADPLALGDVVHIEDAEETVFCLSGPFAHVLPEDPKANLAFQAMQRFKQILEERNEPFRPLKMTLEKKLPVGSGLGSSACSIVAASLALNHFFDEPLSTLQLLHLCGELESGISGSIHYDNVAPALLGGLQLMGTLDRLPCLKLPLPENWEFVICHPGTSISTKRARELLPKQISLGDAVNFGQKIANLAYLLSNDGKESDIAELLVDDLIEPHRSQLIPKFDEAKPSMLEHGALAFGISGSGPTMLTISPNSKVSEKLSDNFKSLYDDEASFVHICAVDNLGARAV